jgi:SAM-dependent methyltransferase
MENPQSAYHVGHLDATGHEDVDADIYEAMHRYLTIDLGINDPLAEQRARQESDRAPAKSAIRDVKQCGIKIDGADVLDLGAGLGALSEELVINGANVIAIEPGAASAELVRRRVERHGKAFRLIECFGEEIPLPDSSVDLVMSLQVLEHVQAPRRVLSEVYRVLRSGGNFYLACENYLAFREGHYQVPWFPMMPKSVGSIYLRLLGRDPKFLREAVTYVTYPGILRLCREIGFVRLREEYLAESMRLKSGRKWAAMRLVVRMFGSWVPVFIDRARLTFKFGVYETFRKPEG